MNMKSTIRKALLMSSALTATALLPTQVAAQGADAGANRTGNTDIIVTAQKREQNLQDVSVAVTAFTQEALEANRITTVQDLTGLAPGMIVRPSAGGIATPSFTMRGQNSFGVVAGSDKQISIYLDGVYISSPRGSIFDLPDVAQIEVLRGPQGTLFGRNATGGAVSITTRDPTGEAFVKVRGSVSNRKGYRVQGTLETPKFGPFTAYVSFVRNYRRGDIRNANPGLNWDRTQIGQAFPPAVGKFPKTQKSATWLGTKDSYSYFGALKFQPVDNFKIVYKYDRLRDTGTPEGTSFIGHDPNFVGIVGPIIEALTTSQPTFQNPGAKRPNVVANGWVTPRDMLVQGHSVTATWEATDSITVKNVFAHRKVFVHATSAIDGVSSLNFTPEAVGPFAFLTAASTVPGFFTFPAATQGFILGQIAAGLAPLVGSRFAIIASQATSTSKQYSNELQVNYNSDRLNITAGAMWFKSTDESGHAGNTATFPTFLPTSGIVPITRVGFNINTATSIAAYAQIEFKLTEQLEVIAGARITRDKKGEIFSFGPPGALQTINPPTYKKTKPNFLIGLNFKPNDDILVYGKFSTSFVSGGASIGVPYAPETATSFEAGVKADLLNRRLRVNLALYHVKYKHFQSPQGTSQASSAELIRLLTTPLFGATLANQLPTFVSTFVIDQGDIRAQGVELEITARPTDGLTMGTSIGFTDTKFTRIEPLVIDSNGGNPLALAQRPKWTGTAWGQYDTQPLFGDAYASFRLDATYFGKMLTDQNQFRTAPEILILANRKAFVTLNGRIALKQVEVGGAELEFALWGKNLTDNKSRNFELVQEIISSANFIPARSYGLDITVMFR
ncbi:MAG: TonB-dependent receptor [Novosphingobium sp.]|nr:TonB-dependent receptor [Novosphingobium sp.]